MDDNLKPVPLVIQPDTPVSGFPFSDTPKQDEVSAKDMIPLDIDDHIPELPIEEARELYDIYFTISPPNGPALKDKNGFEVRFETHEEATEAIRKNKLPDDCNVIETRSLKPVN